jgi:Ca2+-binding EF-hand superfamily protein
MTHEVEMQLTVDEVKVMLASAYATLHQAFLHFDFFKDGALSPIEWSEGIHAMIMQRKEFVKYRHFCQPRSAFDTRMKKLFCSMDKDEDGLITYEDLLAAEGTSALPRESAREFTLRRTLDLGGADLAAAGSPAGMGATLKSRNHATNVFTTPEHFAASLRSLNLQTEITSDSGDVSPRSTGSQSSRRGEEVKRRKKRKSSPTSSKKEFLEPEVHDSLGFVENASLLRGFASLLMRKFPTVESAFAYIDINGNGILSMGEFVQGTRDLRFNGDTRVIFKELDKDGGGTISAKEFKRLRALKPLGKTRMAEFYKASKRDLVCERQSRSPIKRPPPHQIGTTCKSTQGHWTFHRTATGRGDPLLHPNEIPGADLEIYSKDRGPGAYEKTPLVGQVNHIERGDSFKVGAWSSYVGRFGPLIPSTQAAQDRELSAHNYASYEGQKPGDQWSINNLGAHRLPLGITRHGEPRPGPVKGNASSPALAAMRKTGQSGSLAAATTTTGGSSFGASSPQMTRSSPSLR